MRRRRTLFLAGFVARVYFVSGALAEEGHVWGAWSGARVTSGSLFPQTGCTCRGVVTVLLLHCTYTYICLQLLNTNRYPKRERGR